MLDANQLKQVNYFLSDFVVIGRVTDENLHQGFGCSNISWWLKLAAGNSSFRDTISDAYRCTTSEICKLDIAFVP
jgi:hypothetical protein